MQPYSLILTGLSPSWYSSAEMMKQWSPPPTPKRSLPALLVSGHHLLNNITFCLIMSLPIPSPPKFTRHVIIKSYFWVSPPTHKVTYAALLIYKAISGAMNWIRSLHLSRIFKIHWEAWCSLEIYASSKFQSNLLGYRVTWKKLGIHLRMMISLYC